MTFVRFSLVAVLMLGIVAGTWETPVAIAAAPVSSAAQEDAQLGSRVNQIIDVDLIDLDRLREIIDKTYGREQLRLTLEECVFLALDNNQDIRVSEYQPLMGDAELFASRGEFDPILSTTQSRSHASSQLSPEYRAFAGISSSEAYQTGSQTSISGKLHWGTTYDLSLSLGSEKTTWNEFIKEWRSDLTLQVTQPLLRGRRRSVNTAQIRIARNSQTLSEYQLRLTVMNTVAQVVKAYWGLVEAIESVKVSEEALANAERTLDISQKRYEIRVAAAIEVLQSKAALATRQSDLIGTRARVADAEDTLKQLLDMRENGIFSTKQIIPIDQPANVQLDIEELEKGSDALRESIELALVNRPEIHMNRLDIENARIDHERAADDLLPTLNLSGAISQGGRDHQQRKTFYAIRDRNDNSYTWGINASIPIRNRAARGMHQRAGLTVRQTEQQRLKTEQELTLNVRLASRAVYTSQILVESNRQTCALQETNVAAEEKRLRIGVTTSYRVNEVQQDLTTARMQELQARINYEQALVDLRLSEGTILSALGVEFEGTESEPRTTYWQSITPGPNDFPAISDLTRRIGDNVRSAPEESSE